MSPESYAKTLDKLATLLRRKPLTPRQISEALGCCRPTAYQRIEALVTRGDRVFEVKTKSNGPGPVPYAYGVR